MGLFQKLKSALGLDGASSSDTGRSGDVDVTVEREPSTEDEDAVKGTDTATTDTEHAVEATADADTAEVGTDASDSSSVDTASTETADDDASVVDADTETEADESVSADMTDSADAESEADEDTTVETDDSPVEEAETDDAEEPVEGSSDPVTELNGIGPAYAERLSGQGIETVGELAVADAEAIAAETDLGSKRVSDWIAQAREY